MSPLHLLARYMAFPAVFISAIACAQFDIGVSVGAFAFDIHPKKNFISYYANAFSARQEFYPTISISFNDRRPTKRVNITCSLDYAYKEFHAIWGDGGHGFGSGGESDLFLHMVYATIAPDILLGSARQAAFRLGLQLGTAVIGHEQGEHWSFGSNGNTGYSERIEIDEDQYWHRTESRAVRFADNAGRQRCSLAHGGSLWFDRVVELDRYQSRIGYRPSRGLSVPFQGKDAHRTDG